MMQVIDKQGVTGFQVDLWVAAQRRLARPPDGVTELEVVSGLESVVCKGNGPN